MGGIHRSSRKVLHKLYNKVVMPFARLQNYSKEGQNFGRILWIVKVWATVSFQILYRCSLHLAGVFLPVAIGKVA